MELSRTQRGSRSCRARGASRRGQPAPTLRLRKTDSDSRWPTRLREVNETDGNSGRRRPRHRHLQRGDAAEAVGSLQQWPAAAAAAEEAVIAVCAAARAMIVMVRSAQQPSGEPLGTDFERQRRVVRGHETRRNQRAQHQRRQREQREPEPAARFAQSDRHLARPLPDVVSIDRREQPA